MERVSRTHQLLLEHPLRPVLARLHFIDDDRSFRVQFVRGDADVVVCDGFVGNVLLKSSEGLATMITARVKQRLGRGVRAWLLAWLAAPLLKVLRSELAPERYNGACLLGVDGVVVKSHGNASQEAFQAAIGVAYAAVQEGLTQRLQVHLQGLNDI